LSNWVELHRENGELIEFFLHFPFLCKKNYPMKKLLLALLLSTNTFAQNLDKVKLDSFFNALEKYDQAMGSIAMSKDGKIIYAKAIGDAFNNGVKLQKATTNSLYCIGSITKTFTATMIFQLIDEGKLNLEDKLSKFYPKVTNADKITIAHLLNHASGIHNFTNDEEYLTYMAKKHTKKQMLERIYKLKSDFKPNTKHSYSNSNFVLLGFIIEDLTKMTYAKALQERICQKIGLTQTSVPKKQFNSSYEQPKTHLSIPHGAGAITSTPSDLTKFIEALFAEKLTSKKSLEKMKEMLPPDYHGMGLFIIPFNERRAYGHTGGIDGYQSMLAYFPKDGFAIAYCTNAANYDMNEIMIGALSSYFDKPFEIPDFAKLKEKDPAFTQYEGLYTSKQIPLKITIKDKGKQLFGQASGQSEFPLEKTEEHTFKYDGAGIELIFNPDKKEMTLKQRGKEFLYLKE
jgi:D-alanyl-D-alanine carboxypeptidase